METTDIEVSKGKGISIEKTKGIIYAILSSVAFGAMPIFAKLAYSNGSNPTTVLMFRFLISAAILFCYFILSKKSFKVNKKQFSMLFALGVIGYTVTCQMLFRSYNYMSVGLATTIHFVYPAFVCLIGYFLFKEKLSKNKIMALVLSGIGVYVLVGLDIKSISVIGTFFAIASGFTYATNIIAMSRPEIEKLDNKVTTFYSSLFAGLTMAILGFAQGDVVLKFNGMLMVAYLGISLVSTILAIILLLKAIKLIGASSAAILATFEPIVSIILGIAIFGEVLTIPMILGTIFILISVFILSAEKQ